MMTLCVFCWLVPDSWFLWFGCLVSLLELLAFNILLLLSWIWSVIANFRGTKLFLRLFSLFSPHDLIIIFANFRMNESLPIPSPEITLIPPNLGFPADDRAELAVLYFEKPIIFFSIDESIVFVVIVHFPIPYARIPELSWSIAVCESIWVSWLNIVVGLMIHWYFFYYFANIIILNIYCPGRFYQSIKLMWYAIEIY